MPLRNGSLNSGSILFRDQPENGLDFQTRQQLAQVLPTLQQYQVQIFLASHDQLLLEVIDQELIQENQAAWHSLERQADGNIDCRTATSRQFLAK